MKDSIAKIEQINALLNGKAEEIAVKTNSVKPSGKYFTANFDGVFTVSYFEIMDYVSSHGLPNYDWVRYEKPPEEKRVGLTGLYLYEEEGMWIMQEWDERGFPGPLKTYSNKANADEALLRRVIYIYGKYIKGYKP